MEDEREMTAAMTGRRDGFQFQLTDSNPITTSIRKFCRYRAGVVGVIGRIAAGQTCPVEADRMLVTAAQIVCGGSGGENLNAEFFAERVGATGVIGMRVCQQETADPGWIDAVAGDLTEDHLRCLRGATRPGVDDDRVVIRRDQEDVAVEFIGEVEAKPAAADEMDVLGEFHGVPRGDFGPISG